MNGRDIGELRQLTCRRPSFIPASGPEIRLEMPGLPLKDRRRWEAQLNDHVRACDCDGGAIALAIVICVSALSRGVLDMRILRKPAHELVAWMVIGEYLPQPARRWHGSTNSGSKRKQRVAPPKGTKRINRIIVAITPRRKRTGSVFLDGTISVSYIWNLRYYTM